MMKSAALAVLVVAAAVVAQAGDAEKFYATKCASCHGKDGSGKAAMKIAPFDFKDDKADEVIKKAIMDGAKSKTSKIAMKSFNKDLGTLDVNELVKYVRTLKPAGDAKSK